MVFLLACAVCHSSIKQIVKRFCAANFHCHSNEVFHVSTRYNLFFMVTFMMNTLLILAIYNLTMLCKFRKSSIEGKTDTRIRQNFTIQIEIIATS